MGEHILKSYDKDLDNLKSLVISMMENNLEQLNLLFAIVSNFDEQKQQKVIAMDAVVNELDNKIVNQSLRLFSLRNPVAYDLRLVFSASHVSRNLERVGDHSKNIAKLLDGNDIIETVRLNHLQTLHVLIEMLHDTIKAFKTMNPELAKQVISQDLEIDMLYNEVCNLLLSKVQLIPEKVSIIHSQLLVVRYFERIGDHIVSLCKYINFIEHNSLLKS